MEATNSGRGPDRQMFVAGTWTDAADGARITAVNPATEEPLGTVPDAHPDDLNPTPPPPPPRPPPPPPPPARVGRGRLAAPGVAAA
jgi:hypothetical protein